MEQNEGGKRRSMCCSEGGIGAETDPGNEYLGNHGRTWQDERRL